MKQLLAMLRRRAMALWIWQTLFVGAVVWGFYNGHLAETEAMSRMRIAVPDTKGGFLYIDNAGSFEKAQAIHRESAKMAAETIFNRTPLGFEDPERMERLFNPDTYKLLLKDAARDEQVFQTQDIYQSIVTGQIKEISVDKDTTLVSVEGQIKSQKTLNQHVIPDSRNVTIFLRLQVNPDMASNGRFPLVVTNYEYK